MFAAAAVALTLAGSALSIPLNGNFTLDKRVYNNARLSWYDPNVGYGSCGTWYQNTDMVSLQRACPWVRYSR